MQREKFLGIFDSLPTKRKQVLLGLLRGDTREKIMAAVGVSESALTQHRRQLYKDFQIEIFQNEADDSRSGERKLPKLIALCAKYKPELVSPNADLVSADRSEPLCLPDWLTYKPQTWVGRESLITELLSKLQRETRLLWVTGISGVGKTALAECLAARSQNPNMSFHRISFDVEEESQDFTAGAEKILSELGEKKLDSQERNDPKRLSDRLLHKLQTHPYWIQLDALERLFHAGSATEFADSHWLAFLQRCLDSEFPSRLVLTEYMAVIIFSRKQESKKFSTFSPSKEKLKPIKLNKFGL